MSDQMKMTNVTVFETYKDRVERSACIVYILESYRRLIEDKVEWVHITPFHSAIVQGRYEFAMSVMKDVGDIINGETLVEVFLNAPVRLHGEQSTSTESYVSLIWHKLSEDELIALGYWIHDTDDSITEFEDEILTGSTLFFEHVASMITTTGNVDLLTHFISKGMSLTLSDSNQNNIFHNLVKLSRAVPNRAVDMLNTVISLLNDIDSTREMMFAKNNKGYRPIELAAKWGIPEMLKAILNTKDVYRFLVNSQFFFRTSRYDVTHYEGENTKVHKSLLYYLTEMDEAQVMRAQICSLLSSEPIQSWLTVKYKSFKHILAWFLCHWLLFITLYFVQIVILITTQKADVFLSIIIGGFAIFSLVVEGVHIKDNLRDIWSSFTNMVFHSKYPITFTFGYRCFQLLFCATVIINVISGLNIDIYCVAPNFNTIMYALNSGLAIWSLFFFLQLYGTLGTLLIIIQKMIFDTLVFFATIGLVYISFVMAFYISYNGPSEICTSQNNPGNLTTMDLIITTQFKTFGGTLYETVLLILAIMAPNDIYFMESASSSVTMMLYVLLLMVFTVVCLNLLVAIMTKRIEEISRISSDILKLERLSIILYMEERMNNKIIHAVRRYINNAWEKFKSLKCFKSEWMKTKWDKLYANIWSTIEEMKFLRTHEMARFWVDPETKRTYLEVIELNIKDDDTIN